MAAARLSVGRPGEGARRETDGPRVMPASLREAARAAPESARGVPARDRLRMAAATASAWLPSNGVALRLCDSGGGVPDREAPCAPALTLWAAAAAAAAAVAAFAAAVAAAEAFMWAESSAYALFFASIAATSPASSTPGPCPPASASARVPAGASSVVARLAGRLTGKSMGEGVRGKSSCHGMMGHDWMPYDHEGEGQVPG